MGRRRLDARAWLFRLPSFPIFRRSDEKRYGDYRTKGLILDAYDAMQRAMHLGVVYETTVDPPPADPRVGHSPLRRLEAR